MEASEQISSQVCIFVLVHVLLMILGTTSAIPQSSDQSTPTTVVNTNSTDRAISNSTIANSITVPPTSSETRSSTLTTMASSTSPARLTTPKEDAPKFKEIIVIVIVAGVSGVLLILVVIVVLCTTCCRSEHRKATYNVKRKQLDSSSTDSDLTENAFYNVALVTSPNYYS